MTDEIDYSRYFWQGQLVRLRPLSADDAECSQVNSLDTPARQLLQLGVELPTTVELERAKLDRLAGCKEVGGLIVFGIDNLTGQPVGGISLHSWSEKNGTFGFGVIIYRGHRRKGYAADAIRILLRYGFWERRWQKCNSACAHINEGSIALHRALGFQQEGRRRSVLFMNGRYYDDILWGLTREEFDALEVRADVG
jgi:RimJ/RimL family protein N-acetyltransferase